MPMQQLLRWNEVEVDMLVVEAGEIIKTTKLIIFIILPVIT